MKKTILFVGAAAALASVFLVGVAVGAPGPRTDASAAIDYEIITRKSPEGYGRLYVKPTDMRWDSYVAANNDRLRAWRADGLPDNFLDGQYVTIAFSTPVSLDQYQTAVEPLLVGGGRIEKYTAVAEVNGKWGEEHVFQAPSAKSFAERVTPLDGTREVRYSIDGIMATSVFLGGTVTPGVLQDVQGLPYVFMVDTTAIPIAKQAAVVIEAYSVASPYYVFLH